MVATTIIDVHSTLDLRAFVKRVKVVYRKPSLRNIIFNPKYNNDYLLVTTTTGSIPVRIDDVKVIDVDLIRSLLKK
jgi:hypothetical protein